MPFDPRKLGALCDRCPLNGETPVPAELSHRRPPFAIIVGEAPGNDEVEALRPFVGKSGFELNRAMQSVGLRRTDCHITNAVLCLRGVPSRNIERAETEAAKRNKAWMKRIDDGGNDGADIDDFERGSWLSPIEACRPRLMREIELVTNGAPANVITLGGFAARAITELREKPLAIRGGPRELTLNESPLRLLPTLHPAFVMRKRRWTHAFLSDLARARRWFTTGLSWTDPETLYRPSPDSLSTWITSEIGSPFVTYDVETAPAFPDAGRYDAMLDPLRVVGLASHDGKRAVVVPFRSKVDPDLLFYSVADYRAIIEILREFFASPRWNKVGHNAGYYDRMVIESHFKVTPRPLLDTIGLHKFVEPELPHGLDYVGSIYTDIHKWKAGRPAQESETDEQLWLYNARDCAVTSLSVMPLVQAVTARDQIKQSKFWPFLQELCVDLHKVGMYVDQAKRREWDAKLLTEARTYLRKIHDITGSDINPNSTRQLRDLLFDKWDLMPVEYTDSGDPSTGDDSLREIAAKQELLPDQREVIQAVRLYRRRTKYRGTYTLKLRPIGEIPIAEFFAIDDEETEDERAERFEKEHKRLGIVLPDGRLHSDWNAHGTLGWRLSSSNTNLQNVPNKLRDIFTEEPGWCLVGCDQAQLELRMGAALANSDAYLRAFREKRDAHEEFCIDIYGAAYHSATKDHKKALRRTVKELTYASEYRAEVETVHSVMTSSEDEEEKLLYPNMTVSQVAAMHRKWLARAKFDSWWEATDAAFARQGYLLDPILGLRCDFLDGTDDPQLGNKLVNFLCQSGGSAVVHLATKRFVENMPKEWIGKVQLVQQGHDALVARVKRENDLPQRVAKFMEECFTFEEGSFPGIAVRFEGEAKVGNNWKEV